jgi:hypothetical protein
VSQELTAKTVNGKLQCCPFSKDKLGKIVSFMVIWGQVKVNLFPLYFIQPPRKPKLMQLLSIGKTKISIAAGFQEKSTGGKPKLMALLGYGENWQRQFLSSFRETKHSIMAQLLTCEKNKLLSAYSLHERSS